MQELENNLLHCTLLTSAEEIGQARVTSEQRCPLTGTVQPRSKDLIIPQPSGWNVVISATFTQAFPSFCVIILVVFTFFFLIEEAATHNFSNLKKKKSLIDQTVLFETMTIPYIGHQS